jgi:hypothetical protein
VPSVPRSVNKLFTEGTTLPSAALGKVFFAECPIKSTRQSRRHSAKARIPVDEREGAKQNFFLAPACSPARSSQCELHLCKCFNGTSFRYQRCGGVHACMEQTVRCIYTREGKNLSYAYDALSKVFIENIWK